MAENRPTLHHMNHSQSQRILWLLEELQIPYTFVLHKRIASGPDKDRAPASLAETHPLGKSPQLITAAGRVIVESAAIAKYLISTYDPASLVFCSVHNPATGNDDHLDDNDEIRDEVLTSFANASLAPVLQTELFWDVLVARTPWPASYAVAYLRSMVRRGYTRVELAKMFAYLERELDGREFFMGGRLARADFMVSWPVDMAVQRGYVKLEDYPRIQAWWQRCKGREAWKRALEKGGGYDLAASGAK